jgi:hypothetical protein
MMVTAPAGVRHERLPSDPDGRAGRSLQVFSDRTQGQQRGMRPGSRMTPKARARVSAATRAAMSDPAVRQRIREGMKAAPDAKAEATRLCAAWGAARSSVRRDFLASIIGGCDVG